MGAASAGLTVCRKCSVAARASVARRCVADASENVVVEIPIVAALSRSVARALCTIARNNYIAKSTRKSWQARSVENSVVRLSVVNACPVVGTRVAVAVQSGGDTLVAADTSKLSGADASEVVVVRVIVILANTSVAARLTATVLHSQSDNGHGVYLTRIELRCNDRKVKVLARPWEHCSLQHKPVCRTGHNKPVGRIVVGDLVSDIGGHVLVGTDSHRSED